MAFEYGFYNSINGDRKYNALDFGKVFDGVITDGVFAGIGDKMFVTRGAGSFEILVGTGKAWFDHTWNLNTSPMLFTLSGSHPVLTRYDAVVLEVNENQDVYGRVNEIKVIEGTPSSNAVKPTLLNTDNLHQHPLAYVKINPEATEITAQDIEIVVGQTDCPFVTSILQQTDITELFANWNGQFNTWFDNLKAQLTDNVVTNLQNQIDNCLKVTDIATPEDIANGTEGKVIGVPSFKTETSNLAYKVGDILETMRTDLDSTWLLCNGDIISSTEYPDVANMDYSKFIPGKLASMDIGYLPTTVNYVGCSIQFGDDIISIFTSRKYIEVYNPILCKTTQISLLPNTNFEDMNARSMSASYVNGMLHIVFCRSGTNQSSSPWNYTFNIYRCLGDPHNESNWEKYKSAQSLSTSRDNIMTLSFSVNGNDYYLCGNSATITHLTVSSGLVNFVEYINMPSSSSYNTICFKNIFYNAEKNGLYKLSSDFKNWELVLNYSTSSVSLDNHSKVWFSNNNGGVLRITISPNLMMLYFFPDGSIRLITYDATSITSSYDYNYSLSSIVSCTQYKGWYLLSNRSHQPFITKSIENTSELTTNLNMAANFDLAKNENNKEQITYAVGDNLKDIVALPSDSFCLINASVYVYPLKLNLGSNPSRYYTVGYMKGLSVPKILNGDRYAYIKVKG